MVAIRQAEQPKVTGTLSPGISSESRVGGFEDAGGAGMNCLLFQIAGTALHRCVTEFRTVSDLNGLDIGATHGIGDR